MGQDLMVLPEVSMDVFFLMSEKMVEYLNDTGVSHIDVRMLNLMAKVARVYTVLEAILKLWYVAGAPFFQKPFSPEQLLELGPYLWCSKQCVLLTWTSCADYIFDSTIPLVLNACFSIANVNVAGLADYQYDQEYMFNHQKPHHRIGWSVMQRLEKNIASPVDEYDFNYIQIRGPLALVASKIAKQFNNKLDVDIIKAQLRQLSKQTITVRKWKNMPCDEYDRLVMAWEARNQNIPANERQPIFDFSPYGQGTIRPEQETQQSHISAVDIHYPTVGVPCVRIAVHANAKMGAGIILDAFKRCISADMRPQNFVTGLQYEEAPGIFQTFHMDQYQIDGFAGLNDAELMDISEEDDDDDCGGGDVINHFQLVNAGYMSKLATRMLRTFRFDSSRCYETAYSTSDSRRNEAVIEISEDLDLWVYKRHFLKNGYLGNPELHDAHPGINRMRIRLAVQYDELFDELMSRIPTEEMALFDQYPQSFLEAEAAAQRSASTVASANQKFEDRKRPLDRTTAQIDRIDQAYDGDVHDEGAQAVLKHMSKRRRIRNH